MILHHVLAAPVHRPAGPPRRTAAARADLAALAALAERIAVDGIEAHHRELVAALHGSDLVERYPVLSAIAADETAPPIARARAVGRLAAAPEAVTTDRTPPVHVDDAERRPAA